MKTIIVPTDFSPAAINAMNYAADMAQQIDADIILLNVYQIPVAVTDTPLALISVDELREAAERQLDDAKKGLEHISYGKLKIEAVAVLGDAMEEIQVLCEKTQPFAVIMGTMGQTALERTLFGSTTLKVIRHLTWPVISVPVGKEYGQGIRKVGLACDFKQVVETTPIAAIRIFVEQFATDLHVLNVDHNNQQSNPEKMEQSLLLRTALEALKPQYHFIRHKDIEEGINEFAETNNLDMIITIPKKHKLLDGLFRKSSTKQLVFESHVPVMCIHE
jgi:nucleotide-binding universal stress UspA family protein